MQDTRGYCLHALNLQSPEPKLFQGVVSHSYHYAINPGGDAANDSNAYGCVFSAFFIQMHMFVFFPFPHVFSDSTLSRFDMDEWGGVGGTRKFMDTWGLVF